MVVVVVVVVVVVGCGVLRRVVGGCVFYLQQPVKLRSSSDSETVDGSSAIMMSAQLAAMSAGGRNGASEGARAIVRANWR